jgi:beta-galactosidase
VETVGPPATIQLAADRRELRADGEDSIVVPVSILDAQGRLVANASNRVLFQFEGNGRLLGVGNGNPADHDPDRGSQRNAFNGHCLAVIQAGSEPGVLRLTAESPGLKLATLTFRAR